MFDDETVRLKMLEEFFYRLTNLNEDFHNYYILKNKRKIKDDRENLGDKFVNFFFKISFLLVTFVLIIYLYYHFIFWNLIPKLESTKTGMILDFWNIEEFDDTNYFQEIKNLIIFHAIVIMMIWSLFKTIISNSGNLCREYIQTFSGVNILSTLIYYFENFDKDSENNFDLKEIKNKKNSHIQLLADKFCRLMDVVIKSYETIKMHINHFTTNEQISFSNAMIESKKEKESLLYVSKNSETGKKSEEILIAIKNLQKQIDNFFNSHPVHMNFLQNSTFYEKNEENDRFCSYCLLTKPDRTHHCRTCRKCVRKMDHHCSILGVCIGYSNYKSFILMLIYSTILLVFSFFNSLNFCKFYFEEFNFPFYGMIYVLYVVICGILSIIVFLFTCYHIRLITRNISTREYLHKNRNFLNNQYNLGFYNNFKEVFGKNPFVWLFPIVDNDELGGYMFEINENTNNQFKNKDFSDNNSLYKHTDHLLDSKIEYNAKI